MVQIFLAYGVESRTSLVPFCIEAVCPPQKIGELCKLQNRSRYKRNSIVSLVLQQNYVQFFSSPINAAKCDLPDLKLGIFVKNANLIISSDHADSQAAYKFAFSIVTKRKHWKFEATSIQDYFEWINILQFAINFANGEYLHHFQKR